MNKIKKKLKTIAIGIGMLIIAIVVEEVSGLPWYLVVIPYIISYLVTGRNVLKNAFYGISGGQVFDENFLMSIATIGAFFVGEYKEAVAVMIFYKIGEVFETYAVNKSRKSIAGLMDIRPDYANLLKNEVAEKVNPLEVHIDDYIIVNPGEKIPLDGVVVKGNAYIDTKALTGEPMPMTAQEGDSVISGCINLNGSITIKVTKEFGESTVSKVLDLVENASSRKAKTEGFITKFARYYTPAVVIVALLLALSPPLFIGLHTYPDWIYRALVFLVISCPCALVISVPMSFFGGLGKASKIGVLVKGSNYLEVLSKTEVVVFDKTGTITKGEFKVTKIVSEFLPEEELLMYAAAAENYSNHPIATSIKASFSGEIDTSKLKFDEEISGKGIKVTYDGHIVLIGNQRLMEMHNISVQENQTEDTRIYLTIDGKYAGYLKISDEIKHDAQSSILELKKNGIQEIIMLTGDSETVAMKIAKTLGIDQYKSKLLPGDKVTEFDKILDRPLREGSVIFIGDGINDAPVLALADVGIAMGGLGQDAAIEAADVVIMNDELSKIPEIIKVSKKTMKIVRENIIFALGIKFAVLILGSMGLAGMWAAVFADVGVTVIAIINSMRALK